MATMAPAKDAAVRGKQARKEVTRSSHRDWAPAADRPRPQDVLAEQDVSRVPELVPIRHGRMLASPFTFYRGGGGDHGRRPRRTPNSGLEAQLCGDAHLSNFGVFEAPDRRLVFDLNDFDETLRGPFEWDVKRLAASFAVAGRDRGFDEADAARGDRRCGPRVPRGDARASRQCATIDVWYARLDVDEFLRRCGSRSARSARKELEKETAKARNKDSLRALDRLSRARRRRASHRRATRP